ncbi:protein pelota [Galendromus occidentalis]|uniref:Protein pelota homolog n=1 Tax=Galendromus occidentalis TaxID=34638 RepID=A0AAJ6QZ54_9ACAR|nr:protein pelota [Galendromus occidentalis]
MKLLGKRFERDGSGTVTLIPEEPEDMWHLYNLLSVDDTLEASTIRKIVLESDTGSTDSSRVRITLCIQIETIDYDTSACMLRVKGRNIKENAHVKLGAYHTLDLELNRKFKLSKLAWDSVHMDRMRQACDPTRSADVAAVVMQEGIAHICLVTTSMTLLRSKVEMNIPRKRKGFTAQHDKAMSRFYDSILRALKQHVDFDVVKCVLIASPGFTKDHLYDRLLNISSEQPELKSLLDNRAKFVLAHSSSGFMDSLREVLQDPTVQVKLCDTKALAEVKALERFYEFFKSDPSRAFYGWKHVVHAANAQAVDTLLISDKLFRCQDVAQRKRYVKLVELVSETGGEVFIFSSLHISGKQLEQLTGLAAVLRFPMPELEDQEVDSDSD